MTEPTTDFPDLRPCRGHTRIFENGNWESVTYCNQLPCVQPEPSHLSWPWPQPSGMLTYPISFDEYHRHTLSDLRRFAQRGRNQEKEAK